MNPEEKELFNEKIKGIYAAIDANAEINSSHFKQITETLDRIEIQTTKTNGNVKLNQERIHLLDLENKSHIIDCPQVPRIKEIETDLSEYKMVKKYPKFSLAAMIIFGLVLIALTLSQIGVI